MRNKMLVFMLACAVGCVGIAGAQDDSMPSEGDTLSGESTESTEYRERLNVDAVNALLRLNLTLVEGYDQEVYDRVMSADFYERMVYAENDELMALLLDLSKLYQESDQIIEVILTYQSTALNEYDPTQVFTAFLEAMPEPRDSEEVARLVDGAMRGADAAVNMDVQFYGFEGDTGQIGLSYFSLDILQTALASEPEMGLDILQGIGNDAWPMYLAVVVQDSLSTTDFSATTLLLDALAAYPELSDEILTTVFTLGETDSLGEAWDGPAMVDSQMLELVAELVAASEDNPALITAITAAAVTAFPTFESEIVSTAIEAAPDATVAVLAGAESAETTTDTSDPAQSTGTDTGSGTDVGTGGGGDSSEPEPSPPEPDPEPVSPA